MLFQAAAFGPKNPKGFEILNPILIPFGKGIVGDAAATRTVQRIRDVSKDPRYIIDDKLRRAGLSVPLVHQGECLGVVDSEHSVAGFFTDDHESILSTVAALAAARIVHIRAMKELESSRSAFQQLVESASDTVFRSDLRGRFTYVNPIALQLTEYEEAELLEMKFLDLVEDKHLDRVKNFYRDQFRSGRSTTYFEFQIRTRSGNVRWIGQNLQLIKEAGKVIEFQAIARDITSLRMAQSAVSRSEAIQRAMVNASLDAIISIDDGGGIIEFNPAAESIFGYTFEEAFGERLSDLIIPQELREAHISGMKRLLETGESRIIDKRIEVPALHKEGHTFPLELTLTQIQIENGSRFTAFCRDITEQKRNEEALQEATNRAEEYAEAQTRFLSSMSHEIRTPMNAVIGISHLINKTDLSRKQQKYVDDIQKAGNVLLGLINNILDFQKIERGFLQLEHVVFDLHDVLDEVIERTRYVADVRPLQISLEVIKSVPEWIKSDPVRLTQVLSNLLNNAIKFTPKGKVVLRVDCYGRDKSVEGIRFEVEDTGIGIPEDAHARIFDAFAQASSSTTRRYGGSGLGLPIVRQLVKLFGGQIELESEENQGSKFTVRLPIEVASEGQAREDHAEGQNLTLEGVKVLVVEDNPVNQFVAQEILESWNAEVFIASGGEEALEELSGKAFDVVLMDIQMPDMDGFETTERIRNDLGISAEKLPIIALTASALREQRDRSFSSGMNDFVMKPFDPGHLHRAIRKLVSTDSSFKDPASTQEADSLTDWTFFEENYGTNQELKSRIIGILVGQLPGQIVSIEEALEKQDLKGLRFAAHKLLSSVRMVGAHDIEVLCEQIGTFADDGFDEGVFRSGQQMLALVQQLKKELAPFKLTPDGE